LVPGTINFFTGKKKKKFNGDQEGCRLDLKPTPMIVDNIVMESARLA
jgi:hypothetical protein